MRNRLPALLLLGALVSCAAPPPPPPAAPPAPPPPRAEMRPLPPVSYKPLIWQPGHYDWTGNSYLWIPGRYMDRRAAPSGQWQPGYWAAAPGGRYMWQPAHWM